MLAKYGFFRRLGFFGVEPNSARGGVQFLRSATDILAEPSSAIWLTAEGEFSDVRRRPICLRPGLAHLLRRIPAAVVVPVALEYPFWGERTPELLVRVGRPIHTDGRDYSAKRWNALLTARLRSTMDELAELSIARDATRFRTLIGGASGSSRIYDAWRWLKARAARRVFRRAYGRRCRRGPGVRANGGAVIFVAISIIALVLAAVPAGLFFREFAAVSAGTATNGVPGKGTRQKILELPTVRSVPDNPIGSRHAIGP